VNAAQEYLAARVMTAPPQALHLLVVDGALRHAARAEAALEAGDRETAHKALNDARSFVGELIGGLDKSAAPEVVANVASLFVFAYRRLAEADVYSSAEKVRDAAKVLRAHRETWSELLAKLQSSPEPTPAAEPPIATAVSAPAIPAPHVSRRPPSGYDDYQPRSWCG
jgi:flagellar biosynthetic protein FliS